MIKIAVVGSQGRMGQTVCDAVEQAEDMELVARLDQGDELSAQAFAGADVAIDFTNPAVSADHVQSAIAAGVNIVVGTSGWTAEQTDRLSGPAEAAKVRVLVVPNFAISAVLAVRLATQAARYFESAEVIEFHHPQKVDAPSGTAAHTAAAIAQARTAVGLGDCPDATTMDELGTRGGKVEGISVHAVRARGFMASEEILFGNAGETLTIRTDTHDRACYMPGVLLAARNVGELEPGIHVGLDLVMKD